MKILKFLIAFLILFVSADITLSQTKKKIIVEDIDKSKLQNLIKNRKGKILFLNIWASWCAPCKKEFPDLVKLADK